MVGEGKPRAVIVGGSIAGILSAHVLTLAGWNVTVLEKTNAPHRGSPTGAGLGLDPLSQRIRVMASIATTLPQHHCTANYRSGATLFVLGFL